MDVLADALDRGRVDACGRRVACERAERDVDDPVAEARLGRRTAVVQLVRVQDVQLSRQADPPRAAVLERLHAVQGDADRVGVVAMRLEAAAGEVRLGPLEPGRPRAEADAGSFKTIRIRAS